MNALDEWVPAACADVRRMLDHGDSEGAATLAADIEAAAFGRPLRRCSGCDTPAEPGRPWCFACAPCFVPRPDAQVTGRIWSGIGAQLATQRRLFERRREVA